jgi:hypothetical protein
MGEPYAVNELEAIVSQILCIYRSGAGGVLRYQVP